ncbi:hypothetical protein CRUP_021993 [Coryphaenoides rupestris]|nr:hypothetical protein CRUP_021993 [Coryphaenoides rupestris]
MLRRDGKSSYNPYSTSKRVRKSDSNKATNKDQLEVLPNKPNVWLKQLSILQEQPRRDGAETTSSSSSFSFSSSSSSSSSTLTPTSVGFLDPSLSCPATPSWVFQKAQGKGVLTPTSPPEGPESAAIEVEDIPALLRDVARFAEAVEKLKDVVLAEGKKESRRPVAHECLGEVLRVLRQVINTYPLLNTVEILTAAGKLISKVKGGLNSRSMFVSELLMGEVDSSTLLSLLPTEKSRSLENLYAASGQGADGGLMRSDSQDMVRAEEVNVVLQHSEGGVDSALLYAKTISKYMKDLINYVEKRTSLEMEFSKGLQRLYQSCKHSITHMECVANLRKAKQAYVGRCEDYDKAKAALDEAAEEAEATYRTCVADATTQQLELEHTKVTVLRQLQEVVKQSDQTLRSATISYYQIMHMQTVALPVNYQTLCESSKLYDLGQQYAACVRDLQLPEQPIVHYDFEPYSPLSSGASSQTRVDSFGTEQSPGTESSQESHDVETERRRLVHKSWGSTVSEDSVGPTGLESPSVSTNDVRKMVRASSTGTMSSNEDADVTSFETENINGMEPDVVVSTGPFRNSGLSKAAQTHRLRKLRTPSKCRECDSYVYFQGAECEECFLSCHKRCLETLTIQCGHKKLHGRLQLFGRDFSQVANSASDGIPFIITKCVSEIERRALKLKGIYRVNGVKTRVEKLCQAFENGKELVELSQCSPHDISNVLKLYLRQLPEPIMLFSLYNCLMGLAKESLQHEGDTPEGEEADSGGGGLMGTRGPDLVDLGADTDPEILVLVGKLRNLLKELPKTNLATLIAELEQENKMSASNLGIVFGPSLMRPRPTGATVSLSSLVDYPHQARIVETLVVFYTSIFQSKSSSSTSTTQQSCIADGSPEAEEDSEQSRPDSDKLEEEGCGSTPGSLGSYEQLADSDPEVDETPGASNDAADVPKDRPRLTKQHSEFIVEDDHQLSYRDSLDLSDQSAGVAACAEPEGDPDPGGCEGGGETVPALPESEPPDEDGGSGAQQELSAALAELNVNESNNNNNNNNYPHSPVAGLSGHPLTHRCRKTLPLTRNRDSEPEFV